MGISLYFHRIRLAQQLPAVKTISSVGEGKTLRKEGIERICNGRIHRRIREGPGGVETHTLWPNRKQVSAVATCTGCVVVLYQGLIDTGTIGIQLRQIRLTVDEHHRIAHGYERYWISLIHGRLELVERLSGYHVARI